MQSRHRKFKGGNGGVGTRQNPDSPQREGVGVQGSHAGRLQRFWLQGQVYCMLSRPRKSFLFFSFSQSVSFKLELTGQWTLFSAPPIVGVIGTCWHSSFFYVESFSLHSGPYSCPWPTNVFLYVPIYAIFKNETEPNFLWATHHYII